MSYNDSLGIPNLRSNNIFQVTNPNGYGSTNTVIRRYTNVYSAAPFIQYRPSATLGDSFVILKAGLYFFQRKDDNSGGAASVGISINCTQAEIAAADVATIPAEKRIVWGAFGTAGTSAPVSGFAWCKVGDVIRSHDYSGLVLNSTAANSDLKIIQLIPEDFSMHPTNYGFHTSNI